MESNQKNDPGFLSSSDGSPKSTSQTSWVPWVIAGTVILLGLAALVVFSGRRQKGPQVSGATLSPADPYAASLPITNLQMSEASNFAGGKVTYIDGQIANTGSRTVTGIIVQIAFHNDMGELSQKETMAMNLIRTREPYIDTQSVSAAPIKPGDQREFRLIFDHVTMDWNQQYPEVRITEVQGK
ncbi:MAG TPA: DUF2393 family protein [Acidisarcina sp.]|nr:DUF2393 family protein [Acidisarcina sp.]